MSFYFFLKYIYIYKYKIVLQKDLAPRLFAVFSGYSPTSSLFACNNEHEKEFSNSTSFYKKIKHF